MGRARRSLSLEVIGECFLLHFVLADSTGKMGVFFWFVDVESILGSTIYGNTWTCRTKKWHCRLRGRSRSCEGVDAVGESRDLVGGCKYILKRGYLLATLCNNIKISRERRLLAFLPVQLFPHNMNQKPVCSSLLPFPPPYIIPIKPCPPA